MVEEEKLRKELGELRKEHKQLDLKIDVIMKERKCDQLMLMRLKRRKLWVKDRILLIEGTLYEDIIA